MPTRGYNAGDNRFAALSSSPKRKKKSPIIRDEFPELRAPRVSVSNPKYVVVASANEQKPLSHYSCFAVQRSLNVISKDIEQISELRDGNLLLLVKDKATAEKFIVSKHLPGICEIKCKYHDNLNFVKGTIFAPFLKSLPDNEIVKELASEGVVNVFKFTRVIENKATPSGVILLTFDAFKLPETINISWYKVKVREYFPNPMRCKSCQLLGHTIKHCKNAPLCQICSLPPHSNAPSECPRIRCANCSEEHPSNFNKCPKFLQQKDILKIKTQRKCTLKQAREFYSAQLPATSSPFSLAGILSGNKTINFAAATNVNTTINTKINQKEHATTSNNTSLLSDQAPINPPIHSQPLSSPNLTETTKSNNITPENLSNSLVTKSINQIPTTPNITKPVDYTSNSAMLSPITRLTQELLSNNRYFTLPTRADSDSDSAVQRSVDVTMSNQLPHDDF